MTNALTPSTRTALARFMELERAGVDVLAAAHAIASSPLPPNELAAAWREAVNRDQLVHQLRAGDRDPAEVGCVTLNEALQAAQTARDDAIAALLHAVCCLGEDPAA